MHLRFLLLCLFLYASQLDLVQGDDMEPEHDNDKEEDYEETPVVRMENLAEQAIEQLNKEHETLNNQLVNYQRGLRYFALAIDIFEEHNCLQNECTNDMISSALSTYGQAAEVDLDLAEFITKDVNKIERSLHYAKSFCEKGLQLVGHYSVGEHGETYFGELMARQRRLKEHYKDDLDAMRAKEGILYDL